MDRRELGKAGEDAAASFLRARGYAVIARNVRSREGEIDLIAALDDTIAFVEVKTRSSRTYGAPVEAVTWRKAQRIRSLAAAHLAKSDLHAREIRFDVIEVERVGDDMVLTHRAGAF